jgi:thiamine transporter
LEPDPGNTGGGNKLSKNEINTKLIAEISISVALAYVLNLIIMYHLPQGGSVTLGSMVPILILALRRGPRIGIFAGTIFGFVQMFFGGYWFTLIQVILDYPIAFACLGIAGFFRKQPIIGVTLSIISRLIIHIISGVVFFSDYAPAGQSPIVYSYIYNGSYMIPELAISGVLVYLLLERGILEYNI